MMIFLSSIAEARWYGFLILGLTITLFILLFLLLKRKYPSAKSERNNSNSYRPPYARITPRKQGDYFDILSAWSVDDTSQDMIINNIDPNANEAKMMIHKTQGGWFMRMFDRNGYQLFENNKITTFELANKFMEMRQPSRNYQRRASNKSMGSRTIEF